MSELVREATANQFRDQELGERCRAGRAWAERFNQQSCAGYPEKHQLTRAPFDKRHPAERRPAGRILSEGFLFRL